MHALEQVAVNELVPLGWSIINKGWPDLFCFREGTNGTELMAVEVKSKADKLRPSQELVLKLLATVMPVYVLRESGCDGQLREQRINATVKNG